MREDRTGWEIIFDGTDQGLWGKIILPPRPSHTSEVWEIDKPRRRWIKSGRYSRAHKVPEKSAFLGRKATGADK